jgi:hypothetical protein
LVETAPNGAVIDLGPVSRLPLVEQAAMMPQQIETRAIGVAVAEVMAGDGHRVSWRCYFECLLAGWLFAHAATRSAKR